MNEREIETMERLKSDIVKLVAKYNASDDTFFGVGIIPIVVARNGEAMSLPIFPPQIQMDIGQCMIDSGKKIQQNAMNGEKPHMVMVADPKTKTIAEVYRDPMNELRPDTSPTQRRADEESNEFGIYMNNLHSKVGDDEFLRIMSSEVDSLKMQNDFLNDRINIRNEDTSELSPKETILRVLVKSLYLAEKSNWDMMTIDEMVNQVSLRMKIYQSQVRTRIPVSEISYKDIADTVELLNELLSKNNGC